MELLDIIIPAASGLFAFGGAVIGNRTEIRWIKLWLKRHDVEITTLHARISELKK